MKEIIKTQANKRSDCVSLNINGKVTSDDKAVADSFNQYLTNVAQKLIDKMGPSANHFNDF